ncbi:MAG TPA: DUF4157 domain-containing protein [Opitutaceae bacterium]|nr:DUF4157 domain-containing protein [Opitutaceae bacterium]
MAGLLQSVLAPGNLQVSPADDPAEHEAECVAGEILGQPGAAKSPTGASSRHAVLRAPAAAASVRGMTVADSFAQPPGPGRQLEAGERSFFEPRLDMDLGDVRVHADGHAASSAEALNARAYTIGRDIVFGAGQYAPHTAAGRQLLAHELVHTVQQRRSPALQRTIQRTPIDDFKTGLEAMGPRHKTIIDELFKNPKFVTLLNFIKGCPASIVDFKVARKTTKVNGKDVDVFGGVSQAIRGGPSTLTINPQMPDAIKNPLEVVDTVVHELVHLALKFRTKCESKANPFPLSSGIVDVPNDPELLDVRADAIIAGNETRPDDRKLVADTAAKGTTTKSGGNPVEYFERNYGPSASRPKTNYVDLNRQGLEFVASIVSDIRAAHPDIGTEPTSFDNVELLKAGDLLATRPWLNATQRNYSMQLHKDRVAQARGIDPKTFTVREYDMSAIQVVESADSRTFDPNTGGGWGPVGGVWSCKKKSRITGTIMHTFVTGAKGAPPGGKTGYQIIQHT